MNRLVAISVVALAALPAAAKADDARPLTFTVSLLSPPKPTTEYTARADGTTLLPTGLVGWLCEAGPVGSPRMAGGHLVQSMAVVCESAAGKATSFVACRLTSEEEASSSSFAVEDAQGHSVFIQSFCTNVARHK